MSEENRDPAAGSVKVKIFNQIYSLRSSTGAAEHVRRAARAVDERMHAVADNLAVHDVAKVAVLTALNFADELQSLKDSYERELQELLERADQLAAENDALAAEREERAAEPAAPEPQPEPEPEPVQEARPSSWFEAIFDADPPERTPGDERLSSQISTRLQRLRQPARRPSITEGDSGKGE
ncbi:MAG TPA: cell division protein ZapA [Pyrinomonadaceae bacterium]|jgi:cell division protein ZapA (FtsZ GTPase activity inhibitor)|nr:cell division protein ZapA [Pyrinomonadaceae bacterium]